MKKIILLLLASMPIVLWAHSNTGKTQTALQKQAPPKDKVYEMKPYFFCNAYQSKRRGAKNYVFK